MTQLATWLLGNGLLVLPLMLLAYLLGRRWPQKPAVAHGLWLLVFVKLLTPPLIQWELPRSWWETPTASLPAGAEPPAVLKATESIPPARLELEPLLADSSAPPVADEPAIPTYTASPCEAEVTAIPLAPPASSPGQAAPSPINWTTWLLPALLGIWALGAVSWMILACTRLARFQRLLRFATPASEYLQELADDLARDVGARHAPRVLLLPGNFAPMLWSFLGRTCILLPNELLARLPRASLTPLLLHELAHWRRGDHFVRYVELVALAAYWWHPAVWLARHKLREAEEECCDAWVTTTAPATRRPYAVAMLATLDFLAAKPQPLPVAGSGLSSFQHLHRRLTMMKNESLSRSLRWPGRLMLLALALVALPMGAAWSTGQPPDDHAAPQPPSEGGRGEGGRGRRTPPPPSEATPPPPRDDEPRERRPMGGGAFGGGPGGMGMPVPEDNKDELLFVARAEIRMNRIQMRYREEELREAMEKVEEAQQQFARVNSLREKGAASEDQVVSARQRVAGAERQVRLMKIRIEEAQEQHKILEERIALIEKGTIKGRMGLPPFGRSSGGTRVMAPAGNDPVGGDAVPGGGRGGAAAAGPGRGPSGGLGGGAGGGPGGASAGRGPGPFGPAAGGPGAGPGGAGGGRGPGRAEGGAAGGGRRGFPGEPPPGGPEADNEKDEQIRQLKKELDQLRRELEKLKKPEGAR